MKQQILILPGQLFPYRYFKKVHVILPFNLFWRGSVFEMCEFFFYSVYFDVLLLCSFLFCVYFYFYFLFFFAFTLCVISSCYICVSTAVVIFFHTDRPFIWTSFRSLTVCGRLLTIQLVSSIICVYLGIHHIFTQ